MRINFLFWNIGKRALHERIARIVLGHDIHVVMLAECDSDRADMARRIGSTEALFRHHPPLVGEEPKVSLFSRLGHDAWAGQFNSERVAVWRLQAGRSPNVLLALLHLPSRINLSREGQDALASEFARDVFQAETDAGHGRTVVVGDFNMNPFDMGVMGATAFHAVMTRSLASRGTRTIQGKPYPFFYNPMWGHFGDRTGGPPGTHYYGGADPAHCFWNMYDQVLLRPALMDRLTGVEVLDSDGTDSLLTAKGLPDGSRASDHLPLRFHLEF